MGETISRRLGRQAHMEENGRQAAVRPPSPTAFPPQAHTRVQRRLWPLLLPVVLNALRAGTLAQHAARRARLTARLLRRLAPVTLWVMTDRPLDPAVVAVVVSESLRWAVESDRPDGRGCGSPFPTHAWLGNRHWRPLLALLALHHMAKVPSMPERYRGRRDEPAFEQLAGLWDVAPSSVYRYSDRGRAELMARLHRPFGTGSQLELGLHLRAVLCSQRQPELSLLQLQQQEAVLAHESLHSGDALASLWHACLAEDCALVGHVVEQAVMQLAASPFTDELLRLCEQAHRGTADVVQLAQARATLARVRGRSVEQQVHLERALQAAHALADLGTLASVHCDRGVLFERSDVDRALSEFAASMSHYERALVLAPGDVKMRNGLLQATVRMGFLRTQRNDPAARPLLEQARRMAAAIEPHGDTMGMLEHAWGEQLRREGDLQGALLCTHAALQRYEKSGNQGQKLRATCTLAMIHGYLGQLEQARVHARQVMSLASRGVVDPHTVSATSLNLGAACFFADLLDEAIAHYQEALRVATEAGLRTLMGRAHFNLAEAHYRRLQSRGEVADERHGDHHASLAGAIWNLSGDRAALEATGRLKSTVLGVHDSLIYDRMLSGELLKHFDEMSEVQALRLGLALPQSPEQEIVAQLAIANAYTRMAVKERETALSLMNSYGLTAQFAPQVSALHRGFEQALAERDRLAAAWARVRGCPTPPDHVGDVVQRALESTGIGKSEYAERCDLSPATASKHLGQLLQLGLLQRTGRGPATRYHAVRDILPE